MTGGGGGVFVVERDVVPKATRIYGEPNRDIRRFSMRVFDLYRLAESTVRISLAHLVIVEKFAMDNRTKVTKKKQNKTKQSARL